MHTNLNQQILRGASGISVNTCIFSDAVFLVKLQLKGFVPFTTEKWGYKEKIGVQNRTSMDTKLLKSQLIIMRIKILNE